MLKWWKLGLLAINKTSRRQAGRLSMGCPGSRELRRKGQVKKNMVGGRVCA